MRLPDTLERAYVADPFTRSSEATSKIVGACQARARWSHLLDQVHRGEAVTITRHGRPMAVLAPVAPAGPRKTGEDWLADAKRLRKGVSLGGRVTIRQLIDEGRKY